MRCIKPCTTFSLVPQHSNFHPHQSLSHMDIFYIGVAAESQQSGSLWLLDSLPVFLVSFNCCNFPKPSHICRAVRPDNGFSFFLIEDALRCTVDGRQLEHLVVSINMKQMLPIA